MEKSSRVYIAGHRGLVGSAIHRAMTAQGFTNLLFATHAELDLLNSAQVKSFFAEARPEYVFLAAARVGGILANSLYPADFLRDNLLIQTNIIDESRLSGVRRLLFLGSSCIYPKFCPQPIREEYLLSGELEPTNRPYAVAKIAGIEMCWSFNRQYGTQYLAAMPSNLFGPGDNYDPQNSHVLPALIRKVAEAKTAGLRQIEVWGSGTPRREMLYSEDLADACVFLMSLDDQRFHALLQPELPPLINIGSNEDWTIRELAETVCAALSFEGELVFDPSRPDGTPRKLLDSGRINALGWRPKVGLQEGIRRAYAAAQLGPPAMVNA